MMKAGQGMSDVAQPAQRDPLIRAAGGFAIASGIVSAVGMVFLIALYVLLLATPFQALGLTFGMLNDICVAIQYLLTIPIAVALHRILLPHNPRRIRVATLIGISMMIVVIALQMLLVFGLVTFQQQAVWVSLALFLGVGSWMVITGSVARSTGRLPNAARMSWVGATYFGYPIWAVWLGRRLLGW